MKKWIAPAMFSFAMVCTAAMACPPDSTGEGQNGEVVLAKAQDGEKGGCAGKKAQTVADGEKAGCAGKKAQTVADGEKAGCAGKQAQTVADGEKSGCAGKAQLAADKDKKGCGSAVAKSGCCSKSNPAIAAMPAMQYKVGEETMKDSETAEKLAKESGKEMAFVVGEQSFTDMAEATAKLTSALEEYAGSIQTIQFSAGGECSRCPMTAKALAEKNGGKVMFRVAGIDFETKEKAEKAVQLASDAVKAVEMQILVEGAPAHCAVMAEQAKTAGKKVTYKVGDQESCCKIMAGKLLAEAKIRAIVEAAAKANA